MKSSKFPVVILHGWGLRGSVYQKLVALLQKRGHRVFAPDLPGFGNEPLVHPSMAVDDYVVFVRSFMKKKRIKKPVVIGHSFGGRVAVKLAYRFPQEVNRIVLTGVPLTRDRSLPKKFWYIGAVVFGVVFSNFPQSVKNSLRKILYTMVGEWDYYKAGKLKQVFKNVVGEEMLPYLERISVPSILVWGENDMMTRVPHRKVTVVPRAGHTLPYQQPEAFVKAIGKFLV